jgi:tetratricopeptide (TPR) repeat protein
MIAAVLAALVLGQTYYTPAEAHALFGQAQEAYEREDYAGAREAYLKLLERGYGGPDVLFNLGTTCLAKGDLGEAVLYLERARRASPRSADIEANLAVARSKQLDQVVGAQLEEPFIERLVLATSERISSWTFLTTWAAGFAFLFLFRFLRPGRRTWAALLGSALLLIAIPSGLLVAVHAYTLQTVQEGVVLEKTLKARESPRDAGKVSFELHAGLKVRLLEQSGKYVKIRLPNGLEGWTEREGLAEI